MFPAPLHAAATVGGWDRYQVILWTFGDRKLDPDFWAALKALHITGINREETAPAAAVGEAGFVHYELSNFALPGHECLHNWHYWDGSPYLGLGPSAHGYIGGVRVWNVFRWAAYRRALTDGVSTHEGHESPGAGESRLERLWLAFRTNRGLAVDDSLAESVFAYAGGLLETWRVAGWVVRDESRIRFTAEGWLRLDELVAALEGRMPTSTKESGLREGDGVRDPYRA